jgi:hypothetical protein
MGPLWAEIMENINPIVDPNARQDGSPPPAKFALFSGHDDTIMPLLATLGPNVWDGSDWPPYASMVLIEVSGNAMEAFLRGIRHGTKSLTHGTRYNRRFMRLSMAKQIGRCSSPLLLFD